MCSTVAQRGPRGASRILLRVLMPCDDGVLASRGDRRIGVRDVRGDAAAHHTEHLSDGFMGEPAGHWNTSENSFELDSVPMTLRKRTGQRVTRVCVAVFSGGREMENKQQR